MSGSRSVYCKDYHVPRSGGDPGLLRSHAQNKSRCPGWAMDEALQQRLIDDALVADGEATDFRGRPKRIWNAVDGVIFVGVSCNLEAPIYNCYPELPPSGKLVEELARRKNRTVDEVLYGPEGA